MEVDDKHRDHGHHDLEDDHAVEESGLERGQGEKLVDQDGDGDVGETEGSYRSVSSRTLKGSDRGLYKC